MQRDFHYSRARSRIPAGVFPFRSAALRLVILRLARRRRRRLGAPTTEEEEEEEEEEDEMDGFSSKGERDGEKKGKSRRLSPTPA